MAGTILYIDDTPELPEGFEQELLRLGYRLRHTSDPAQGMRVVQKGAARLVLLEVLLSSCDGFELLERIRACGGEAGRVPVVILTRGERSPELYGRAVELEADDFLCKPTLSGELLASIRECSRRGAPASQIDPANTDRVATVEAAFSGDLAECPLPEVLLRLRRIGATGVLLVQHETESRGIQLRNGSPVAVASNRRTESLEDFLVRTKRISGAEHEQVAEQVLFGLGSPREVLVGADILSEKEVDEALLQRAAEPLLEGFAWPSGSYRFQVGSRLKSGRALEFEQSPGRILMDGVMVWTPSPMIRKLLDRRAGYFVSSVERPLYSLEEAAGWACEPEIVEALQGDRTVAQVLASGATEERLLYGLLVAGLVEVHPEPTLLLARVVEEPEIDSEAPEPVQPEPADEAGEIALLHADTENAGETEETASRSVQAESWFRRGEEALLRRRYDKALEAFGMAAHLDPSEGEYSAHLGYTLHLSQPKNALVRREALEHIAKGIKLSPGRWKPLVFLGRVFAAAGEPQNARKVLRRALKIEPDCHAARQELRLLDRREQPGSAIQRLFGKWGSALRRK